MMMYELCNIIEFFQPIEIYETENHYKRIGKFNSYKLENEKEHKIHSIKQVVKLLEKMKVIYKKDGFYYISPTLTFYNVLFDIDRKKFNDLRLAYLSRVYAKTPERM